MVRSIRASRTEAVKARSTTAYLKACEFEQGRPAAADVRSCINEMTKTAHSFRLSEGRFSAGFSDVGIDAGAAVAGLTAQSFRRARSLGLQVQAKHMSRRSPWRRSKSEDQTAWRRFVQRQPQMTDPAPKSFNRAERVTNDRRYRMQRPLIVYRAQAVQPTGAISARARASGTADAVTMSDSGDDANGRRSP